MIEATGTARNPSACRQPLRKTATGSVRPAGVLVTHHSGYGQFCPVSMASEILCSRWTTLVLRELLCGSTRFNDLRRRLPKMSPALLSKRLKELQGAGVVIVSRRSSGAVDYQLSESGKELQPLIMGFAHQPRRVQ